MTENSVENQPLVSIVISVFNSADYLREAMDSILTQTYPNMEILCFDDGSTDDTLSILKAYEDDRLKIISDGENKGLAARLNEGIELAQGVYIARMDADDIALPTRIEKQVSFLENQTDVVACGTGFDVFPKHKRVLMPASHEGIVARQLFSPGMAHPTVMLRRQFLMDKDLRYPSVKCAQDYALWVLMARYGKMANLNEVLFKYRHHENSVTNTKKQAKRKVLGQIHKEILRDVFDMPPSDKDLQLHAAIAMGQTDGRSSSMLTVIGYTFKLIVAAKSWQMKKEVLQRSLAFLVKKFF